MTRSTFPPNIVWICADDYTPDFCSAYGSPHALTPALDRLAAEGLRFDRVFATCPLSTPSRQSFWTGRYPRRIGVTLSPTPLPGTEVSLPQLLRQGGYLVAALGKTHFYAPQRQMFDLCLDWPDYCEWRDRQEDWKRTLAGPVLGRWRPFVDPPQVWLNSTVLPYPAHDEQMFGTFLARAGADFIRQSHTQPFFLYLSPYETHSPFNFPVEFRGRHHPSEFKSPWVHQDDWERLPDVFQQLGPREFEGIRAAYATCAEFMDRNVGLILSALEDAGLMENTLVIFSSDHGYLLGQHGRAEKHCCYEPAVRAALLLRWPGVISRGTTTGALVELHDIVPTILELCGLPIPDNLDGRSLNPLIEGLRHGTTLAHRDRVFVEYADHAEGMIRTDRWKLIYSAGNRIRQDGYAVESMIGKESLQLFDLHADPDELENRAIDPGCRGIVTELLDELTDHLLRTERFPDQIPRTGSQREVLASCLLPTEVRDPLNNRRTAG
ncbi:MAG TPA: hypothetical protein DDY91_19435 [Planctomycetaceae bacterium]|nr:hypothetical protein [Planctomycetaceae bacterium]